MTAREFIQNIVERWWSSETGSQETDSMAEIDGEAVPVHQVDYDDGRVIASVHVETAVDWEFDFTSIWIHKDVDVMLEDREFEAEVDMCSVEHGFAAIGLVPDKHPSELGLPADEHPTHKDGEANA